MSVNDNVRPRLQVIDRDTVQRNGPSSNSRTAHEPFEIPREIADGTRTFQCPSKSVGCWILASAWPSPSWISASMSRPRTTTPWLEKNFCKAHWNQFCRLLTNSVISCGSVLFQQLISSISSFSLFSLLIICNSLTDNGWLQSWHTVCFPNSQSCHSGCFWNRYDLILLYPIATTYCCFQPYPIFSVHVWIRVAC